MLFDGGCLADFYRNCADGKEGFSVSNPFRRRSFVFLPSILCAEFSSKFIIITRLQNPAEIFEHVARNFDFLIGFTSGRSRGLYSSQEIDFFVVEKR